MARDMALASHCVTIDIGDDGGASYCDARGALTSDITAPKSLVSTSCASYDSYIFFREMYE
jgi:hypothetical protein